MKAADKVMYYEEPKKEDEMTGGDFQQVLSFIFAFAGTWMKVIFA